MLENNARALGMVWDDCVFTTEDKGDYLHTISINWREFSIRTLMPGLFYWLHYSVPASVVQADNRQSPDDFARKHS